MFFLNYLYQFNTNFNVLAYVIRVFFALEAAEKEKERMEVKQRQARALMKKAKEKLPRYVGSCD